MSKSTTSPRRWPDLLIGLLVLLLLGGFGTLLLRGTPQTTTPGATSNGTNASAPADTGIPSAPGGTVETAPAGTIETAPTAATTDSAATTDTATTGTTTATDDTPVIEAAPIGDPQVADTNTDDTSADPASTDASSPDATSTDAAQTDEATTDDTPGTAVAARPEGAVATSEARVPLRSDYRITLGTFSSAAAAQNAAAAVQGLGYTVYPIDVGTQVVAQIGPFADEQSARQALADVHRAYPSALLYPPRAQSGAATPATPAATTPAATPPAPSGPTYLQVGAFDRVESAQNLVQQLRDLGYNPTVNAPEGKKVTVLVGPYENPDALTRTETRLATNGLDSFRIR
ncbi:SPOR domain-containing protein [Deinococcus knuensis]|uniref:SPOR domain-containing protein n=1 Tax=Deinococcus knuensis TaxID=1837380 RepID=A0ABQ2SA08_9DEIO|nr:SPOR domain-containing protein [Deinococcus knuensis]GGS13490.1 hypothetical protein GCM10008961_00770 [Deinococcus knuensis]